MASTSWLLPRPPTSALQLGSLTPPAAHTAAPPSATLSAVSVVPSGTRVPRGWAPSPCSLMPLQARPGSACSRGSVNACAQAEDEPGNSTGNSEPQTPGCSYHPQRELTQKPSCFPFTFLRIRGTRVLTSRLLLSLNIPPSVTQRQSHMVTSRMIQDSRDRLVQQCHFTDMDTVAHSKRGLDCLVSLGSRLVAQEPSLDGAGHWTSIPGYGWLRGLCW